MLKEHPFIVKQMQEVQTCLDNNDFDGAAKNLRSIAGYICEFYFLKNAPDLEGCYRDTANFPKPGVMCSTLSNARWVDPNAGKLLEDMIEQGNRAAHPEGGKPVLPRVVENSFHDLPSFLNEFIKEFPREVDYNKPITLGKVKLSLINLPSKNGYPPERAIDVKFVDVDEHENYKIKWDVEGLGERKYKGLSLKLRNEFVGKFVIFTAILKKSKQTIVAKAGPIENKHFSIDGSEDIPYTFTATPNVTGSSTQVGNAGNQGSKGNPNSSETPRGRKDTPQTIVEAPKPPVNPLPTVSDLEKELAMELLKTQEDYDKEE